MESPIRRGLQLARIMSLRIYIYPWCWDLGKDDRERVSAKLLSITDSIHYLHLPFSLLKSRKYDVVIKKERNMQLSPQWQSKVDTWCICVEVGEEDLRTYLSMYVQVVPEFTYMQRNNVFKKRTISLYVQLRQFK